MSDMPPQDAPKPVKIDMRREIAHSEWKDDPVVGYYLGDRNRQQTGTKTRR